MFINVDVEGVLGCGTVRKSSESSPPKSVGIVVNK